MKYVYSILIFSVVLSGCGYYQIYLPAVKHSVPNAKIVNKPYDVVFADVLTYLSDKGLKFSLVDKQSGIATTEDNMRWGKLVADSTYSIKDIVYTNIIDCGYIKSTYDNMTRQAYVREPVFFVNVVMRPTSNTSTYVRIDYVFHTYVTHKFNPADYASGVCHNCEYPCYSKGQLETDFFTFISK